MSALQAFAGQDLATLLEGQAARQGARPFLRWAPFEGDPRGEARSWSYAQFVDDVRRTAGGLRSRGVKAGDCVLLNSENCPEFLLTWFACAWIGAVCVAVNPKSAGPEISYFAAHTGAALAVTQPGFAALKGDAVDRASPGPEGPLGMMFTSGTTSRPKAVLWHHANALWAAREGAAHLGLRADDVCLLFQPLYHVVGLAWTLFPALWAGAEVVLQPKFSASRFWDAAVAHRATVSSHVQFSSGVLSRMPVPEHRFRVWGNSTWTPQLEAHFRVPIVGWWGMTELVSPGIVGHKPLASGAIGRPANGYEIRLVDGEMRVRGERGVSLFAGYYGDPDATRDAFDGEGWFRTGDRMRQHEDGSLSFVERVKDVIKVGGEGVSAAEVERVIRLVEGVAEAAVVGRPDPAYGEVCVAFVVAAAGAQGVADRVLERCKAELAGFKVPRDVRLIDALPRANLDKVAKGELRRLALMPSAQASRRA